MMTSQILKSVNFTKTPTCQQRKKQNVKNETFFLQIKKIINYTSLPLQKLDKLKVHVDLLVVIY